MSGQEPIVVVDRRIDPGELSRLVELYFEDMVKLVIDIERRVAADGGRGPATQGAHPRAPLRAHRAWGAAAVTQHRGLTPERWSSFDRDRQILMIANEMHRGSRLEETEALRRCYERVLRLTDLTVQVADRPAFRRELLRWRDGVAELYAGGRAAPEQHRRLLHCLLLMSPEAARQRRYVLR